LVNGPFDRHEPCDGAKGATGVGRVDGVSKIVMVVNGNGECRAKRTCFRGFAVK
jgi:hypothetical protein